MYLKSKKKLTIAFINDKVFNNNNV